MIHSRSHPLPGRAPTYSHPYQEDGGGEGEEAEDGEEERGEGGSPIASRIGLTFNSFAYFGWTNKPLLQHKSKVSHRKSAVQQFGQFKQFKQFRQFRQFRI